MKKKISKTVRSFLKEAEISYTVENDRLFKFVLNGDHADYNIRMMCDDDNEVLIVVVSSGMRVPEDKIEKMCRWITEKNHTLFIGGFAMDTEGGELDFRLGSMLKGGAVNTDVVVNSIVYSIQAFEEEYEDIVEAMYMDNDEDESWELKLACEEAEKMKESCESETDKRMLN